MTKKGPDALYHYVLIKDQDKVIMVHAVPKNTVLPKSLKPAADNHYYEFRRLKPKK